MTAAHIGRIVASAKSTAAQVGWNRGVRQVDRRNVLTRLAD